MHGRDIGETKGVRLAKSERERKAKISEEKDMEEKSREFMSKETEICPKV